MYGVGSSLRAVRFDVNRLETIGDPIRVLEDVLDSGGVSKFALSENGSLVYLPADSAPQLRVGWVDREGRMTALSS